MSVNNSLQFTLIVKMVGLKFLEGIYIIFLILFLIIKLSSKIIKIKKYFFKFY